MNVASGDGHDGRVGAEGFVFYFFVGRTVESVGEVRPESLEIEVGGAVSDFLVRSECETYGRVRFVAFLQALNRLENFRDTGLVVRPEEGRSVRGDDVLTAVLREVRVFLHSDDLGRIARKDDVLAVVILVHDRLDVLAGRARVGVDVRDEADDRGLLSRRQSARECGVKIAVRIQLHVGKSHGAEVFGEDLGELELLGSGGETVFDSVLRRGVNARVFQETFD